MEKKIFRKKLLILLMIISIVATDFFILGSNLLTYSSDIGDETNNPNVEFSVYFKNDANVRDNNIEKSVKDENLKLYAEIAVKNEGYLNEGTAIELEDSNFKLKGNISSNYIKEITENKVILKQITAGETIEIELDIEPIISDILRPDMLSKISIVKLNGSYTGAKESGIQYGKEVCITFKPDETAKVELETEIITNKVLAVNGTNKRVMQLSIKSRLTDNQYPIEQTTFNLDIPHLGEETPEISVIALRELATNGNTEISDSEYTINENKLQITLKNEKDTTGAIKWCKNSYDELVVTYIYEESVDLTSTTINVNSEIKLYEIENTLSDTMPTLIENEELNQVIIGRTEITTKEIYKGQLYANAVTTGDIDVQYQTKTTIAVTNEDIVDTITVNEGADVYETTDKELPINTKYISTEINLNKMLTILGQDGNIEIKNGETTTVINKDTAVNENGNVVINHENSSAELVITTSKPENKGVLEIIHTKVITENNYTRKQIETVKTLKTKGTIVGTNIVENSTETTDSSIELKETITKAELTIENNKQILSTTEANQVTLGITLTTNGTQYDLYKNSVITLQLPQAVENVEIIENLVKQNADEFEVSANYDSNNKQIKINLIGEQTVYPESELTQAYLQFNLNVTLSKLATTQSDKIIMTYTNENASQYDGGTVDAGIIEKTIQIEGQHGLLKMFNLSSNEDKSLEKDIRQQITEDDTGKIFNFETILINNTDADINNVRILGKLPTIGNNENTLETILHSINAPDATIYYTEDATADINDSEAWTETYTNNAKMYLIKLKTLNKGSNYSATIKVQMPSVIEQGLQSYTAYKVIYDTEFATNIEENSRKIILVTSELQINLIAQVGHEQLSNGSIIKEGEVIKYIATVTNNTEATLENIILSAEVPTGTVVVKPIEGYNEYILNEYYEEKTDEKEISLTIPTLSVGETYETQYEVRVNTDITTGTEISNQIKATYNNKTATSQKITNKVEEANIRVTIKKANDKEIKLTSGSEAKYDVIIENLTDEKISNLGMRIISDDFTVEGQEGDLGEIPANGKISLKLKGKINNDANKMHISAIITDLNNSYRSNMIMENLLNADATISLTTPQNNAVLKKGDIVEYNIVVENTGNISEYFKVYYVISDDFDIQTVSINGKTISQTSDETDEATYSSMISNLIYEGMNLEVGETGNINIIAIVKNVEQNKTITNKAKVEVLNVYKAESQEITHTLVPEPTEETNPDEPTAPKDPTTPDEPTDPKDPTNPDDPTKPENPDDSTPVEPDSKKTISGLAWLDSNRNGQKDNNEKTLEGIKTKIYNVSNKKYIAETITDSEGKYIFDDIEKGSYIIIFEYNTEKYEPTTYCADGVDTTVNSKVILKKINIDGQELTVAVTDTINIEENVLNINIGLKEKLRFDLELNKYISRIVVQTSKKTKAYDYKNDTFEKVEIHRKEMQGALVVLEYAIKVKNTGDIPGYAKNIVDYLPSGLTFSSELNSDWYASGTYLYTKGLENVQINPGEEKEIKLILTKTMTNENVGLINNRAEIYSHYNQYGETDIDSIPNNQVQGEDDLGSVDVIIQIATGGSIIMYIILMMINIALIGIAIKIMIKNDLIKISTKEERR